MGVLLDPDPCTPNLRVVFFFLTFLISAVIPGHVLTSGDLKLGHMDEREQATFGFLGLTTSLTMVFPRFTGLSEEPMIPFFFI